MIRKKVSLMQGSTMKSEEERQAGSLSHGSRRDAISRMGCGFGGLALGSLLGEFDPAVSGADSIRHDLRLKRPHHAPRARAVIQLFMHGGPSQVDLLDPKPELSRRSGQAPPAEVADDENRTTYLSGSPFKFSRHGQSGLEFLKSCLESLNMPTILPSFVRCLLSTAITNRQSGWPIPD